MLPFRYSQRLIGLWRSYFDVRDMINNVGEGFIWVKDYKDYIWEELT